MFFFSSIVIMTHGHLRSESSEHPGITHLRGKHVVVTGEDVDEGSIGFGENRSASAGGAPPRVVVSFTTFPFRDRMSGLAEMLRSMDNQTWRPDRVIANFPDDVKRLRTGTLRIPDEVDEYRKKYSWLYVHQTDDYGPATKLLGALQIETDPDTIIIVLDDDTVYHPRTISALVSTMQASRVDVAPCFQCEGVRNGLNGTLKWSYVHEKGVCYGFASGYAAYAVRPRYFDASVWDQTVAPAGCWLHDDVWISGSMLAASAVRPYVVKPGFASILREKPHQNTSVNAANQAAKNRGEDLQGACVSYFGFYPGAKDDRSKNQTQNMTFE